MQKIPKIATASANSQSWVPLVIVNDGQGVLNGIGVAQAHLDTHHIQVEIDGDFIGDGKLSASVSDAGNDGLNFALPFNEELYVYIRDDTNPSATPTFWASYVIEVPEDDDD